jgi:hypothetical protein
MEIINYGLQVFPLFMASEFSMEINVEKTRIMTFRGMEPIKSKICINNKTLKQNIFNYLG